MNISTATIRNNNSVEKFCVGLVIVFSFFLPISTTLVNICFYGVLTLWFLTGNLKNKLSWYLSYPLTKSILLLALVFMIGMTYTSAPWQSIFASFRDLLKILAIPILAYYLHQDNIDRKNMVLVSFIASMVLVLGLSFLKAYTTLPIGIEHQGSGVFKNHIQTSYFMAMAIYILFIQYYNQSCDTLSTLNKMKRVYFWIFFFMLYYLFFINTGRTGYIVLCAAFLAFSVYNFRFKGLVTLFSIFLSLFCLSYLTSEIFAIRINELYREFILYINGSTVSSLGSRLEFALNSLVLFLKRPILGFGTGSFETAYSLYFSNVTPRLTDNPHNEYLRVMVELGLMGLSILLLFFRDLLKQIFNIKNLLTKQLALGIIFAFIIGCFINSWMSNFTECQFFCLIIASLLPTSKRCHEKI